MSEIPYCGRPTPHGYVPVYFCMELKGHSGDHIAHYFGGEARWGNPDGPPPTIEELTVEELFARLRNR